MTSPIVIMVMSGPFDGTIERLNAPQDEAVGYVLGRKTDCDVSFHYDRWVSGKHARLYQDGDQWYVEDMGSTNKTFLAKTRPDGSFAGKEQIFVPTPIDYGQLIQLGRVWVRVQRA